MVKKKNFQTINNNRRSVTEIGLIFKFLALLVLMLGFPSAAFGDDWPTEARSFEHLKKMMKGEPSLVLVVTSECIGTARILEVIRSLKGRFGETRVFLWEVPARSVLPNTPYNLLAVPSFNYFEANTRLDIVYGWQTLPAAQKKFLPDFLNRTIHKDQNRKRVFVAPKDGYAGPTTGKNDLVRKISKFPWFPYELSGLDFSNLSFVMMKSFTGSNLEGANFDNSTLDSVSFAGANLKDASFEGAKLTKIFWGSCICPDGSSSHEHGFSCDESMTVKLGKSEKKTNETKTDRSRSVE